MIMVSPIKQEGVNLESGGNQMNRLGQRVCRYCIFGILTLVILASGCTGIQKREGMIHKSRDGILVHISSGERSPQSVLTALQVASTLSETRNVLVYFDRKGIEVVLKDSKDLKFSHYPSSHTQIKNLLNCGVLLCVCPESLKSAGKTPADLMPRVRIANPESYFGFTRGRIVTLDY